MTVGLSDPVANTREIRMRWPEVRNALGADQALEVADAIVAAGRSLDVRAVILSAEGPAFSSGGNLRAVAKLAEKGSTYVEAVLYSAFQNLYRSIRECPVPVIALVEGPAIGLGCDLALACDARIASETASFRYGWANVGLISAVGGLLEMRRLIGGSELWSFISGQELDGRRASELGVAVFSDNARIEALNMASRLCGFDRDVIVATKHLSMIQEIEEYLPMAAQVQARLLTQPGFAELARKALERGPK